jgi:amidase
MVEILGDAVGDELLSAFRAYERALMDDDLPALDDAFVDDERALRGDVSGLLVGHAQISAFRGGRGGAPQRTVRSVHARRLDADHVVLVSVNEPVAGGSGLVTQVWQRCSDGRWRIAVAQVAGPAPAADSRIWRVVGHPLVPPTAPGPLDGESIAVKDLFSVAGFPVGAGNPTYLAEALPASTHAVAVRSLLNAGAEIRGIARTDEFAYSIAGTNTHYGTPPNPRAPRRIPGGSSNGPAAAVAMGHASIGLGTDTAGSIRVPASYQGLWGLRTTHGAVSVEGLLPLAPSFDAVGWLTRTPELLAKVAEASLGREGEAAPATCGEFAVCPELLELADPAVRAAFQEITGPTASAETAAPALVSSASLASLVNPETSQTGPDVFHTIFEAFRTVQAAEAWRTHGSWLRSHPGAPGPDVATRFAWAATVTADRERNARAVLATVRRQLDATLEDKILLLPTAPTPAPLRTADAASLDAVRAATISLTCLAAITGRPAISAPLLSVDGAPVGLSLLGPRGADLDLVARAAALVSLAAAAHRTAND